MKRFILLFVLIIIGSLVIYYLYQCKDNSNNIPANFQSKIVEAHKSIVLFNYDKANTLYKAAIKQDNSNNKILEEYLAFLISQDKLNSARKVAVTILKYNPNHFLANLVNSVYLINKNKINLALNTLKIPAQDINSFNNALFAILSSADSFITKQYESFDIISSQIQKQLPDFYYNQLLLYHLLEKNYDEALKTAIYTTNNYPSIDNIIIYSKLLYMKDKSRGIANFKEYLGYDFLKDKSINNYLINYDINNLDVNYIISDALLRISKYLPSKVKTAYINPDNILVTHVAFMLNHNNTLARMQLAAYYINLGDYNTALKYLNNINKKCFYYRLLYPHICKIFLELGQTDQAINILKSVYSYDSTNPEPLLELGHIYYKQKNHTKAINTYSEALNISKSNKLVLGEWLSYYFRGIAYNSNNDWNASIKDLNNALSINNEDPLLLNYLGYSLIDRNVDINKGLKLVKKALEKDPNNPNFLDSYSWGLFKTHNYSQALKIALVAYKKIPLDFSINNHLGDIYYYLGNKDNALLYWNKSLNLNPDKATKISLESKLQGNLPRYLKNL